MRIPAFPRRSGNPDQDYDQGSEWDDFLDSADVAFKLTGRDEIARASRELLGEAEQDWMSCDTVLRQSPPGRAPVAERAEAVGRGIRVRALFDVPFTRQPLGREFLRSRVVAGEQVRLGQYVPFRMQIADLQACLIWSSPEDEDHARVVYSPAHVVGIRNTFELLWAVGWDYECTTPGDSGKPTPEQLVLARLLGERHEHRAGPGGY